MTNENDLYGKLATVLRLLNEQKHKAEHDAAEAGGTAGAATEDPHAAGMGEKDVERFTAFLDGLIDTLVAETGDDVTGALDELRRSARASLARRGIHIFTGDTSIQTATPAAADITLPRQADSRLLGARLHVPKAAQMCPGVGLLGRTIRSFVFSTDIAAIRYCDAEAVLAVYPFSCQPAITQALISVSARPVLTGIAGNTTSGPRSVVLAIEAEMQGVSGVVMNYAATPALIASVARCVDVPVVATVTRFDEGVTEKIGAGADVLNIAAGSRTPEIVAAVRAAYPDVPIIATCGPTEESAMETVEAGADAISWTPPSLQKLEKEIMAPAQ